MHAIDVRILQNIDPISPLGLEWENLVSNNPQSGFMQSLYWSQVKTLQGLSPFHLGLFQNNQLIGGAIFYTSKKRNGANILIAPEGPVLPWDNEPLCRQLLKLIIDTIRSQTDSLGIMAIRIEPRLSTPLPTILREFGRAPVDLVPRETLYIDLSLSTDALLQSMKEKGRYNIKLSQRHHVSLLVDKTSMSVNRFYAVMQEASTRDGFALEPLPFFVHLANILCPAQQARFFFAEHEDDTLGALLLITYGKQATYLYGGITDKKRNLMGGYALQWAAMQAAKESGCTTYDFYGFDQFRSPDHQYGRFSQFKSQFGGNVVTLIGAQDYFFLDNLADAFIKVINETKGHIYQC